MSNTVKEIQKRAFKFFLDHTNFNENESGYGLTLDHNEKKGVASIAATGFMLSSYIVAVEYNYMSYEEAAKRVLKTLETLFYHVPHYHGFFVHFVDIDSARRNKKHEYSTIDTALVLNGILAVQTYFKEKEIKDLANKIINRVDWEHFVHIHEGKTRLYMAYNPDKDGSYSNGNSGFIHQWDMFAEQLMMYVIIAGMGYPKKLSLDLYNGFNRVKGKYLNYEYYMTTWNTLFVYQYPLAWLDLENYYDLDGINWFENAKLATLSHRAWTLRHTNKYKTFNKKTFGLTASSTKGGYGVYSVLPNEPNKTNCDGTMAPNAMIGSLIFTPKYSLDAIEYMKSIEGLWGKYGFKDAYNFEDERWISNRYISIDKGLELLMSNAYLSKDVQNAYMNNPIIKKGIEVLGWTRK